MIMTDIQIVHVVAVDNSHCIGKDNQLAWHIPDDLKHFKSLTTGGVIIMGRKTFKSLGRPLPNRTNIVITRDTAWQADDVKVAHSLEHAISMAKNIAKSANQQAVFIIGGGEIYKQSLDMADRLEITYVNLDVAGDTFYPSQLSDFQQTFQSDVMTDEKSGIQFRFSTWQRKLAH
ncbi:dihydrofolate reductase [Moraxella nasovis]|uniref:dihydrofolate reductase n=1 Tax=Moraxella nasovis TaxID=2904121 RepID=UPI001F61F932|nr:dihydrofolate reductase [Moraxella nasovis]UNU74279.1 dihydrofolate reductase [Moraxella nasovis]